MINVCQWGTLVLCSNLNENNFLILAVPLLLLNFMYEGRCIVKEQPIIKGWKPTSLEKSVMNKHENESIPLRSPN